MKSLIALLSASSILFGQELEELPLDASPSEEIASFDTLMQSITTQEMQIPAPIFEPRPHKSPEIAVALSIYFPVLGTLI